MKKRNSPYYSYMESFFEKGNMAEIASAKKEYRRQYKSKWKRKNRTICKEVTVKFSKEEYKEIQGESKRHQQKLAPFIKLSSIAYIRKTYVVPDSMSISKILQLLKLMYIHIEDMKEDKDKGDGDILLQAIGKLEHDIRIALLSPIDLEMALLKYIEKKNGI